MALSDQPDLGRGLYGISVAAELSGVPVQSLRLYESKGLLEPERTDGGTRRYSTNDVTRARQINDLSVAGVNLTGIATILHLEAVNAQLRSENVRLRARTAKVKKGPSIGPRRQGTTR